MRVAVLSDGAWGTALALTCLGNGHGVVLWSAFPDYLATMRETRANPRYLPGVALPPALGLTTDITEAVRDAEMILLAAPAQYLRGVLERLREVPRRDDAMVVNVAKGIEVTTLKRMSEVVREILGPLRYAALSGPSHAEEVARAIPTAVVVAAADPAVGVAVQEALMSQVFRVYTSDDVTGVELGGALKNVLALAAGVCDGMGFGDNTKAALMTRGIVEMARLGSALGGRSETFSGLSGIGDLIVTCMSRHSRNRFVGEQLGRGRPLEEIVRQMGGRVAEGVTTAAGAYRLARGAGVETPIIDQVHAGLYEGRDPRQAVRELMTREAKPEHLGP
ncbi:MAG: NAD(P)-dependent glycerol-3-phosphate dehydrogenase [Lentisphaeria bacterium]|nr:NAD(P)-dependent glycerol-3-phosphate dehydrogenase [Lentisphaeria bacterium]